MRFFVLFLIVCPAWAEWRRIDSDHFTVVTDSGDRTGREVARQFEQIRAVFLDQFPKLRVDSDKQMLIFAVRDTDSFTVIAPEWVKRRDSVGGVFTLDAYRHYVVLRTDMGDNTYDAVFHEYAHMVFSLNWDFLPVWLNEGLAEYFSQIKVYKNEVRLGTVPDARARELASRHFLPIHDLLTADHNSDTYHKDAHSGLFYSQSWLLVHYLYLSDQGRKEGLLQQVMNKLHARVPSDQAIAAVLGDDTQVMNTLKTYLKKNRFPYYTVKTQIRQEKEDYRVSPVSPQQLAAYRGALAAGTRLATLVPEDLKALEGAEDQPGVALNMALMAEALQDFEAAAAYAAQATQLNPDDWQAAFVAARVAPNDAARGPYLDRMIALRPDFAPAYVMRSKMLLQSDPAASLALMKQAVALKPGDFQMRFDYTRRLLWAGKLEEGLDQGQVAARLAPSDTLRRIVTDLMTDAQTNRNRAATGADIPPPNGPRPGQSELVQAPAFDRKTATKQPLAAALLAGDTAATKTLLASGKGLKDVTYFDETPLHLAAETGQTGLVKALLKAGLAPDARDKGGNTPLLPAAAAGHTDAVVALLEAGADKNAANAAGTTALMAAALAGHTGVVKALIAQKADREALDGEGYSAIDYVNHLRDKDLYRLMRDLRFPTGKGTLKGAARETREEARAKAMEAAFTEGKDKRLVLSEVSDSGGFRFKDKQVATLYRDAVLRVTDADSEAALPLLLKSLELEPDNEGCADLLVHVYLRLGNVAEATNALERYIPLSTNLKSLAERYFGVAKAILAEQLDNVSGARAEKYLRRAVIDSGDSLPQAHYYLGYLYLKFGADSHARDAFQRYLDTGEKTNFALIAEREVKRLNVLAAKPKGGN